ncbi:MAG: hypothetical protein KAI17_00495 [Thiotrichaceae bacterium]|nr:hypothetical protein [Thiotrichaceae bacterium]
MKKWFERLFLLGVALLLLGCNHMAYLGIHGKSIQLYPDIHESVVDDVQCLECHHPDNLEGPVSPHSEFTGCIKCHND